jgi:hypothetical protein
VVNLYTLLTTITALGDGAMGVFRYRDPAWAARQSAAYSAERRGEDVEADEVEPTPDAVERA